VVRRLMIPRLAKFSASAPLHVAFLAELRARGFEGSLSPTYADRTVFSTDNSIYQIYPQAIAFPKSVDDLVRIARLAAEPRFQALKLAPRGGGTGTNGQSLTDGLVVDLSRDMNRILEMASCHLRTDLHPELAREGGSPRPTGSPARHRLLVPFTGEDHRWCRSSPPSAGLAELDPWLAQLQRSAHAIVR
jgi:hypothetical protein